MMEIKFAYVFSSTSTVVQEKEEKCRRSHMASARWQVARDKVISDQGCTWCISGHFYSVHKMAPLEDDDVIAILSNLMTTIYLLLGGMKRRPLGQKARQSCTNAPFCLWVNETTAHQFTFPCTHTWCTRFRWTA